MAMFNYFCLPPVLLSLLLGYINRYENPVTRTALLLSLETAAIVLHFCKKLEIWCLPYMVPQTERGAWRISKVICN